MIKKTYEEVKKAFEDRGYILVSEEYVNSKRPLEYICKLHSDIVQSIQYNALQQGCGCKYCKADKLSKLRSTPEEKIKRMFEERGYIIVDASRKNPEKKIYYKCPKHPEEVQGITLTNFKISKSQIK